MVVGSFIDLRKVLGIYIEDPISCDRGFGK